jgi:hypothetical protein
MIKRLKIGRAKLTFVFKHMWQNDNKKYNFDFRDYRFGFWFRVDKIVGSNNFNKPKEWSNNLVNSYMFGIDLIVYKFWISFDRGGMYLKTDEEK